jgi:hypothetical protein
MPIIKGLSSFTNTKTDLRGILRHEEGGIF